MVVRVEHHPPPTPLLQDRTTRVRQRHPAAEGHAETVGESGIRDGPAQVGELELELDVEDDVAVGALEAGVAVGEIAVGIHERAHRLLLPIPGAHLGDRRGDVLSVGADVLDRGGPRPTGYAAEPLDPRPAFVDGADHVLPRDGESVGEIEVRGPWVTTSYYKDPAEEKFHDGWLRTGDVGTIDARGFIRISDRAKDVVKSGGEWALQPGSEVTPAELRDFLKGKVAKWWLPELWAYVENVPRTSVGKYDKKLLRHQLADGYLDVSSGGTAAASSAT